MQIIFSNKFGTHSKSSIILSYPELIDVSEYEIDIALDQGWLITAQKNREIWYQSRSTRTRLDQINYKFLNSWKILDHPYPVKLLDNIYNQYCLHKHYRKYFEVNEFLSRDIIMSYYLNDSMTAWTKLRKYSENAIESTLFVWDYQKPESHLGINSLRHELAWAKTQDYKYFYMGPGYEKNSIYKSDIDGFEWWTGREWSQDVDEYIWLCKRDSMIGSYAQLHTALANLQHDRSIL
jgi:hypothetical protein